MWKLRKTQKTTPSSPQDYPTGICLHTEKGYFLLHKDGKRYKIVSNEILSSWNFPRVVQSSEAACINYKIAFGKLGFRDGSLLWCIGDGKMYLVSDNKLRHVQGPDALARLGVTFNDAAVVSQSDLNLMKMGEPIV